SDRRPLSPLHLLATRQYAVHEGAGAVTMMFAKSLHICRQNFLDRAFEASVLKPGAAAGRLSRKTVQLVTDASSWRSCLEGRSASDEPGRPIRQRAFSGR